MIQIAETFTSIQGEGHLTGKRMHFVRFAGCSVEECGLHPKWFRDSPNGPGCDTDWSAKEAREPDDLVRECLEAVGPNGWVCITGGEPCDQAEGLARLGMGLHEAGLRICLETSGTQRVPIKWDWISVSPKGGLVENLKVMFGQELKIVYRGQDVSELRPFYERTAFWDYYLMPYDKPRVGPNTAQTIAAVHKACEAGMDWKFCAQAHKDWGVR